MVTHRWFHVAISNMATIQLALRHTFTADSLSLQMRLPAIGGPIPKSSTSGKIAFGYSCIEVTAITSVWTVRVLTGLAQVSHIPKAYFVW